LFELNIVKPEVLYEEVVQVRTNIRAFLYTVIRRIKVLFSYDSFSKKKKFRDPKRKL